MIRLCLDCCKAKEIKGLSEKYTKLEVLTFILNDLKNLEGLPKLPSLKKVQNTSNPGCSMLVTML
jgi:acidic leucine-rich nuclear phosphoprotein 32 family protein A/C/D/acidic leucine-rich nuclear phosphoprotein 32 family protein B